MVAGSSWLLGLDGMEDKLSVSSVDSDDELSSALGTMTLVSGGFVVLFMTGVRGRLVLFQHFISISMVNIMACLAVVFSFGTWALTM